jgi:hypothetical protein
MRSKELLSRKDNDYKNDISHNPISYTINTMKDSCKGDAPGLELDMKLIEREIVVESNMHDEGVKANEYIVNFNTHIPHPKAVNELAETAQQRSNSIHTSINSNDPEFIVNAVQTDVMNQDCGHSDNVDSESSLIQYLNAITLEPDNNNVKLSEYYNSDERCLPFDHISNLLDYENDSDEIEDLLISKIMLI